jgi:carbamoyltransferase
MGRKTLGISAFFHDSAAALLDDGHILAAAQEERFSRIKHDASFPAQSIQYCLVAGNCTLDDVDAIVYYETPRLKRDRQLRSMVDAAPWSLKNFQRFGRKYFLGQSDPLEEITSKLNVLSPSRRKNWNVATCPHHVSHAASAFYPSPFEDAVVVTVDGVGEWDTTSIFSGRGNVLTRLSAIHFPHSLGLFYSAFTAYCGFRVNDGEYKLMGLAPYGDPRFAERIRGEVIKLNEDGSFRLNMDYFDFLAGSRMFNEKFEALLGGPPRARNGDITKRHMDVAASVQKLITEALLTLTRYAVAQTGARRLCFSGGVALNCVANGEILRSGAVDDIWIQPAAGDAGGALGCALQNYYSSTGDSRTPVIPDSMRGARLGPNFTQAFIEKSLGSLGANYDLLNEADLIQSTAEALARGEVVGWFDGAMEFGPRALGGRSILADARRPDMQRKLNLKVKHRESFRPFAPIVLAEEAHKWFNIDRESPYMLIVASILEQHRTPHSPEAAEQTGFDRLDVVRSVLPAVTHVDYSARIQTVDETRSPRLHALLSKFSQLTGVSVLVNTSFNVNDEPIVCSPTDAYRCFLNTDMDRLIMGNAMLVREQQLEDGEVGTISREPDPSTHELRPDDSLYTLY